MTSWLENVTRKLASSGALVRVAIVRAEGSTPREAGAAMLVTSDGIEGTIGGGALELEAIGTARAMLRDIWLSHGGQPNRYAFRVGSDALEGPSIIFPHPGRLPTGEGVSGHNGRAPKAAWPRETRDYPLGPSLGQCCGGFAKVLFELFTEAEARVLRELSYRVTETALVVRPVASGFPLMVLAHRKEGYSDLPVNALRVTRDLLSGARPLDAAFISGIRGGGAWFVEPLSRERTRLYLYGAGHVGRALIRVLEDLPFEVTWVDTDETRFPAHEPGDVLTWEGAEARPPHPALLPKGRRNAAAPSPLQEMFGTFSAPALGDIAASSFPSPLSEEGDSPSASRLGEVIGTSSPAALGDRTISSFPTPLGGEGDRSSPTSLRERTSSCSPSSLEASAGTSSPSTLGERVGVRGSSLTMIASRDPAAVASSAPVGALHLVMTYSHPLDLAICHAILKSGTSGFLGVIGSQTKQARFVKRLRELGHDDTAIGHLTCPIGLPGLPGKEPATIAISVAAQLLQVAASAKTARYFSGASEASQ